MGHAICNWPSMHATKVVINVGGAHFLLTWKVVSSLALRCTGSGKSSTTWWALYTKLELTLAEDTVKIATGLSVSTLWWCILSYVFGQHQSRVTTSVTPPYKTGPYLVKETGDITLRLLCTLGHLFAVLRVTFQSILCITQIGNLSNVTYSDSDILSGLVNVWLLRVTIQARLG